jgi:hypothetical protein
VPKYVISQQNDAMIFTMVQVYAIGILPCKNKVIGLIEM